MSGGSYNYLYCHASGLEQQRGDIEEMVERLAGLGYAEDAAEATRRVLVALDEAEQQAQALADVWRAVEWWDSGDTGEDSVKRALDEYRGADS